MECAICLEPCNKSTRKDSSCLFCSAIFCRKCLQEALLLEESLEIHCPGCKAVWNRDFIDTICTLTFRTGAFKAHREKILLDSERIRLPDTQEDAAQYQLAKKFINRYESKLEIVTLKLKEQTAYNQLTEVRSLLRDLYNLKMSEMNHMYNTHYINIEKNHSGRYNLCTICNAIQSSFNDKYTSLRRRVMILEKHYTAISSEEYMLAERYKKILRSEKALQLQRYIQYYGVDKTGGTSGGKRAFIKACPVTDCRGFLSTQWKCGICDIKVCKDCHDPILSELHRCEPDKVASVKLIAAETRSCPKCSSLIFKTHGCFAKDTPILLWNGSTKMSQDIVVGDILVGDDGTPRTVLHTVTGEDELYKVSQLNGADYIVNSKHKLVLKFCGDRSITWNEKEQSWKFHWFDQELNASRTKKVNVLDSISKDAAKRILEEFKSTIVYDTVIEITIDNYLKLPNSTKDNLKGFKNEGISYPHQDVTVDPYLLGLYIGDGVNTGEAFAINAEKDPEILRYLLDWCESNNAEIVHEAGYLFRIRCRNKSLGCIAIERGATSASCKGCTFAKCAMCDLPAKEYTDVVPRGVCNPLKKQLSAYDLIRNKHIPLQFLMNDRTIRLQVLAGLIDTDGYVGNCGKRLMIAQSKWEIARQIEFLAKSLGFIVTARSIPKKSISFPGTSEKKDYPDHLGINISGEALSEIPCKVARKKCIDSTPNKDYLKTAITITPIGKGTYYGWSVDKNKRFILPDFTVVRNCDQMFCIECKTAFSWTTGAVETGHIHNPHYYDWMRTNGLAIPRAPVGVLVCEMDDDTIIRLIRRRSHATVPPTMDQALCQIICNRHVQIQHYEFILRRLRAHIAEPPPHKDVKRILRVRYLINEISETEWKIKLQKQEKHRHVIQSRVHIVEMYLAAFRDILNTFIGSTPLQIITQLNQLLQFTIEQYEIMNKRIQSKVDITTYIPMWEDSMWGAVPMLPSLAPVPPPVAPVAPVAPPVAPVAPAAPVAPVAPPLPP